jgi:hypothetical protein
MVFFFCLSYEFMVGEGNLGFASGYHERLVG